VLIEYDNQSRDKQGADDLAAVGILEKMYRSRTIRVFGIAAVIIIYLTLVIILRS
jgi:hypothetical protein